MKEINHSLLVLARESRGFTQSQLVEKIPNLHQGNYSKIEKGILSITPDMLARIASALGYNENFFYKKSVNTPISSFYYRKRVSLNRKDLSILESKLDILRMMIDELLESVDVPVFNLQQYEINEDLSASEAARKIREALKLPRGPIQHLIEVLEVAGIIIYFFETNTVKFDGITLVTDTGQPVIFVNNALPNDRKLFTIAHELCHLICHIPFSPLPVGKDEEAEANEFAGEFLMPYLDCRYDLSDLRYSSLGTLKTYWRVSKAAIIYRAKEINAITNERYTNLNIELSKNGEKKKESGFVELAEPKLVNLIINVHENDLGYTLEEMLQLLGIGEKDYFTYFNKSKHQVSVTPKKVIDFSSYLKAN